MNLIRVAIERPVAVIAAVLMAVLFGYVALQAIPVQLAPDVRKPVITVETNWPGAAPAEVEREIINPQEEELKGLEGLERIVSSSQDGQGEIELEFTISQDMNRALLLVANRLDRVTGYPPEADEPSLSTAGSEDNAIAWFRLTRAAGNTTPIHHFGDFAEDVLKARVERVPGVSQVNVFGGAEREMKVVIRPEDMARYRLTVPEVVTALRNANISLTAGDVDEGKRRYVVRTEGEFTTTEQVGQVVLRSGVDEASGRLARVIVADIADVAFGYKDPVARIRANGEPAIAMNATRETGANVIEVMAGIKQAVEELKRGPVAAADLEMIQLYDETIYINSAIDLVLGNIWIGGMLAAAILLLFLRSFGATLIISIAIPISVIASFVAMAAMGRSINVISLAGIAFAVGMVVDASIVVLENIYRLRQEGLSTREAAYKGASQVWGAVFVSALTTVMVFIPILVRDLEVSQLFRDIAVAISVSVLLSLLVAVTVIPALAQRLLGGVGKGSAAMRRLPVIDTLARWFVGGVMGIVRGITAHRVIALSVVGMITAGAAFGAYMLLPKLEYLPEGNRNLVFGIVLPPPGYNLDTTTGIAQRIESASMPLWASESGPESAEGEPPKIRNFFFVALRNQTFLGAQAVDEQRAAELIPVLQPPIFAEPGTFGFITQPSLFGRGIGGGRAIELNISGPDLETILGVALQATGRVSQTLPREEGHQLRPIPGLELGAPEVRLYPDRTRLADAGISAQVLAQSVDVFNDGLRVAEITVDGERMDLILAGPEILQQRTQAIEAFPIPVETGQILPAAALAEVRVTSGPTEIRHLERVRTVTLEIRPSPALPLEAAMDALTEQVIAPLEAQGLPPSVALSLSGTADALNETWAAMQLDLLLAVVIVFLVMAVLFESFLYPLVIMLAVPVAAIGGLAGLAVLNMFSEQLQPLHMLTLLGFVILIGIVVNNAILLVHQTLYHYREEGLAPRDAILTATRNRIRPIFMSTITSVFGMLPLVLFPGAGSELYRGLGSVVVGGLSLSALITLLIVPPMLAICLGTEGARGRRQAADQPVPRGAVTPAE